MVSGDSISTAQAACEWLENGDRVVAAILVETMGSSPLDAGAEMFISDRGKVEGSVTGGCVESALVVEAEGILAGNGPRLVSFGISDSEAAGVGLTCGGTVRIFLHEIHRDMVPVLKAVLKSRSVEQPVAVATLLDGPEAGARMAVLESGHVGSFGKKLLDHNVEREARGFVEEGASRLRSYGPEGEVMGDDLEVMFQAFQEPPQMLIYGAIDYSVALARLAGDLGYRVTICDAREPFAQGKRFAAVADVVVDWPDRDLSKRDLGRRDAVLVFTHDPKFDQPAIIEALKSEAGYIGALGSRRTQAERAERLREAGLEEDQLRRLHAPCGLDLGARTPEETAISILAEIVAERTGRSAESLRSTDEPIHAGS